MNQADIDIDINNACAACGDYPVDHFSTYINNTFGAWEHDLLDTLEGLPLVENLSKAMRRRVVRLEPQLIRYLHLLSGGKTHADIIYASTDRAVAIWREAQRRGIRMEQLVIFGSAIDSYRALIKGRWEYFESLPIPIEQQTGAFAWSDDKFLFKRFLQCHRIPAAEGFVTGNLSRAHELLKSLRLPVVVKPRMGSNSRHTTPLVHTIAQFDEAFALSQQLGRHVLVEEYFYGNLCRATVVDGVLVGFLESKQATVTGNGVHTIRELIDAKNAHKQSRVPDVLISSDNEAHISRQGYLPESVIGQGITIRVARLPGRGSGGENREMLAAVHQELRDYVEHAAQLLRTPVVGFDLIVDDPEADPDSQRWGILEANTVPFIEIHSEPLYGEPSNVAAAVWDLWQ